MKRIALIVIVAFVIVPLGLHWQTVRQLENAMQRISGQLSPLGRLEWDRVRLDRQGNARFERAELQLRESQDLIRIEQLRVSAGSVLALPGLARELNAMRLPDGLVVRLDGLSLPVNRELDRWIGQRGPGLPFPAAGCAEYDPFSFYDFGELGLVELMLDLSFEFNRLDPGNTLEVLQRMRVRELGDRRLAVQFRPVSDSIMLNDLPQLMQTARLISLELEYIDQGYYTRLLEFCAGLADRAPADHLDHHVQAWSEQWAGQGLRPGPLVVAGYQHYLSRPRMVAVTASHSENLRLVLSDQSDPAQWLAGLDASFRIDQGTSIELGFSAMPRTPMIAEQPAEARELPEPFTEIISDTEIVLGPAAEWVGIRPDQAGRHIGQRAQIQTRDEQRHSGRIAAVDPNFVHLTSRSRIGEFTRPIPMAEIESIRVRP